MREFIRNFSHEANTVYGKVKKEAAKKNENNCCFTVNAIVSYLSKHVKRGLVWNVVTK